LLLTLPTKNEDARPDRTGVWLFFPIPAPVWCCLLVVSFGFRLGAEAAAAGSPSPLAPSKISVPGYSVDLNHPPRAYVITNAGGWTIWIERELVEDHASLASNALARLRRNLAAMLKVLPDPSHRLLQARRVFLMLGEQSKFGGKNNGADYFQRTAPAHFPQLDPRMASSVLIYSATNYVWLSDLWAIKVLVHEFAHAWQLEQWPEKQPDILAAYEHAMHEGLYQKVKADDGSVLDRAYAATNQLEYFAELSCVYFVGCNYYPFNREQLKAYDPVGFDMIRKLWRLDEPASSP
jgi:hypothetical protein